MGRHILDSEETIEKRKREFEYWKKSVEKRLEKLEEVFKLKKQ